MKTRAVRLYGKEDLRLEEFDLPEMAEENGVKLVYVNTGEVDDDSYNVYSVKI